MTSARFFRFSEKKQARFFAGWQIIAIFAIAYKSRTIVPH